METQAPTAAGRVHQHTVAAQRERACWLSLPNQRSCANPKRVTIHIDDYLLAQASKLAGPLHHSSVVKEGLRALIQGERERRFGSGCVSAVMIHAP
jgi:Arc/MetJ family transcription regulator